LSRAGVSIYRRFDVPLHGEALKISPSLKILIKDTKAALSPVSFVVWAKYRSGLDQALLAAGFTV
jgi:hypothetical protein